MLLKFLFCTEWLVYKSIQVVGKLTYDGCLSRTRGALIMSFIIEIFERYEYKNGSVVDKVRELKAKDWVLMSAFSHRSHTTCFTSSTSTGTNSDPWIQFGSACLPQQSQFWRCKILRRKIFSSWTQDIISTELLCAETLSLFKYSGT